MKAHTLFTLLILMFALPAWAAGPTALILSDPALPDADPALVKALSGAIQSAGYIPSPVSVEGLLAQGKLSPAGCRLLVLPRCRALPTLLAPVIADYLKAGGHLIALGAPAWDTPLIRGTSGRWVSLSDYGTQRALEPPTQVLFPFTGAVDTWTRSSDHPDSPVTSETVDVSANGHTARALHVTITNLQGYDTLASPLSGTPRFPAGITTTVFSAKGDARTRALAVEWEERDGARWIATVPLTDHWQRYSLPPSAFHSWANPPERAAQGFHPENAARFRVGLAFTHTGGMGGAHEYWISAVGVSTEDGPDLKVERDRLQPIDTLAPRYKFFTVHGPVQITADPAQALVSYAKRPVSAETEVRSSSPRPGGGGYDKGRLWRWIPLLRATDAKTGEWRGTPATLTVHAPGDPYAGGAWLVFGIENPDFYRTSETLTTITAAARRMRNGLFLLDAGADHFTVTSPNEPVRLGAQLFSLLPAASPKPGEVATTFPALVQIKVTNHHGSHLFTQVWALEVSPGAIAKREVMWQPPDYSWPADGFIVTTTLIQNGKLIDRVRHELNTYGVSTPHFIQAHSDGHFYLNNRLWRINGVNYLPSSGIAQEDGKLYEKWMSRESYDPEVIERDLAHIQALGMNAVSIFIYRDNLESQNLLDVLRRCRNHHLYVNLSLRPGVRDILRTTSREPLKTAIDNFTTIIRRYHLERDDIIFAYETDWEPNFGNQQARRLMDPAWAAWIAKKYGDVAGAEHAWNHAAPHDDSGALTNPSGALLAGDDKTAVKLVADYRHFLDDWLAETYGAATRAIHAVAPQQRVSFRMASTGFPGDDQRSDLPYQFEGLTHAVDFLSPECYGRVGGEEGEQGILFETAYARAVGPHLPVIWAETGFTAWDVATQQDDPGGLDYQGKYLDTFYKLAIQSGADGIFFWWYPGGFRVGENSDYGIINPDGTPRPSTLAILQHGKAFLDAPPPPAADVLLEFNRDAYPDGIHGVFRALRKPFVQALQQNRHPGLRPTPQQAGATPFHVE